LEIATGQSPAELNSLRIGWDLVLDVDSPYLEYSKIYTDLLIKALKSHGIKNIGVKFSGSKGMHIIIPWKAFPKQVYGIETKNMFPEFPRTICSYLSEILNKKFEDEILKNLSLKEIAKLAGKNEKELLVTECKICHRNSEIKYMVTWICPLCKTQVVMQEKNKRVPKCPDCRHDLNEYSREQMHYCMFCAINSNKNPELFEKERVKTEDFTVADLILVSPRHLFRMPYSLHEKTSLASVVIDSNQIKEFQIKDAMPFKIQIKEFMPDSRQDEAKNLLLSALDWKEQKDKESKQNKKQYEKQSGFEEPEQTSKVYKEVIINNLTDDLLPPCINLILQGVKQDGRKRALFLLINYFKSLKIPDNEIEKRINSWNDKNYSPLHLGYIKSQLDWYKKNNSRLPPNCDKVNYKELNICKPDELCRIIKNPVTYSIKKYFQKTKS
jgi:hypothetical protein